jgi:hypothetical protein
MSLKIFNKNNDLVISSLEIASQLGVEHKSTLQIIEKYSVKLELFGRVAEQTDYFKTNGGTQKRKIYYLNENQFKFILSKTPANCKCRGGILYKDFGKTPNRKIVYYDHADPNCPVIPQFRTK